MRSVLAWIRRAKSSASGVSVSTLTDCSASKIARAVADQRIFPPAVMVEIKALACELPSRRGLPLARWSLAELRREAMAQGLVAQISGTTLWRWLSQDALRPWRHRCWISRAILPLPSRPAASWTSISIVGRTRRSDRATMCCAPTRRPASKHADANIPRCHPVRDDLFTSSTNTLGPARGPTSLRGMSIARSCLAAASARPASCPSNGWSLRSCASNRIGLLAMCSGSSTTAPLTAASAPPLAYEPGPISSSSTPRSTPVGSGAQVARRIVAQVSRRS